MNRLTRSEVVDVVGRIDDVKLAEIIALDATAEELEEAVTWASGITRVGHDLERPLAGVVAKIYEILVADQEYGEERE